MFSPISRDVRTISQRAAIILGLGYLLLVVVPVTATSLFLIDAGHPLVGVSLLGISVGVTVFSLFVVGFVWLLVSSGILILSSFLASQRRRVLRWAAALENAHWWARLVRLSDRLAFLDHRSAEEKRTDRLERLQSQYVSGVLSETEFERRLDSLLWGEPRIRDPDVVDTSEPVVVSKGTESQLESRD